MVSDQAHRSMHLFTSKILHLFPDRLFSQVSSQCCLYLNHGIRPFFHAFPLVEQQHIAQHFSLWSAGFKGGHISPEALSTWQD